MSDRTNLNVPAQLRPSNLSSDVGLRWVPEYGGEYAVTDDGRVFSFKKQTPSEKTPSEHEFGYDVVHLWSSNEREAFNVHRLVLRAFEREPEGDEECRHLNGNPADNRIENLEWGTRSDNISDAIRHGSDNSRGENNPRSKLTASDVREIRSMEGQASARRVCQQFNMSPQAIRDIWRGKTWTHIE